MFKRRWNQICVRSVALSSTLLIALLVVSCATPTQDAQEATTQPAPGAQAMVAAPAMDSRFLSGLLGSSHDFSQGGTQPADLCLSCHSPHITGLAGPLLDRRPATTQPVTQYFSGDVELDRASLLCLSCHDGVIAQDVFTSSHATSLAQQLGSSQLGSQSLSGHPIGVKLPLASRTYRSIAEIKADGRIHLPGGRVQCISCHDPHNTGRHPAMLVMSNNGSRLCLSCHRL